MGISIDLERVIKMINDWSSKVGRLKVGRLKVKTSRVWEVAWQLGLRLKD